MKKILLIGCGVLVLFGIIGIILVVMLVRSPEFQKGYDKGFKGSFRESFIKSCSKDGPKNATEYCTCMADHLVQNSTTGELTSLSLKSQEEIQNSTIMKAAFASCSSSLEN